MRNEGLKLDGRHLPERTQRLWHAALVERRGARGGVASAADEVALSGLAARVFFGEIAARVEALAPAVQRGAYREAPENVSRSIVSEHLLFCA